jgi:hypothetical protein
MSYHAASFGGNAINTTADMVSQSSVAFSLPDPVIESVTFELNVISRRLRGPKQYAILDQRGILSKTPYCSYGPPYCIYGTIFMITIKGVIAISRCLCRPKQYMQYWTKRVTFAWQFPPMSYITLQLTLIIFAHRSGGVRGGYHVCPQYLITVRGRNGT